MTTARRKTTKKVASKDTRARVLKTEYVPVSELRGYHKNARIGDIDKIIASLEENGQYKPIVVNVGTHTGRPNEILVGNHTWLASRRLEWEDIYASFIDVTDARAAKINIADNFTQEDGSYDEKILAEQIADLPDTTGIGMDQEQIDTYLSEIEEVFKGAEDTMTMIEEREQESLDAEEAERRAQTFDGAPLGEEPDPLVEDVQARTEARKAGGDERSLTDASSTLKGAFDLKEEIPDETVGYWQIPKLRLDNLMRFDELPDKLESWAGSATKDWPDDETWWLYNWQVDSTSGMKDISKVIVSFYTFDEYFDNWFWYPAKFVTKVINSGIKYIVQPNYSQFPTEHQTLNLYALYRARWMARYFQECGLKVIPDINWPMGDIEFLEDYVLATLPKKLPMISLQLQTFNKKDWGDDFEHSEADQIKHVQRIFDVLEPQGLLLYAGKPGQQFFEEHINPGCPVRVLDTRNSKLTEKAKGREKKTTI